MGANAQTTVPTFVSSQVLTADQQNQSARTGVPVFATTGTRDAGFGGTGEKTLAEGQLCYVEGTGLQTYNGTSWVTWGAAPSTGALVFLTGATFTTAATVSLPNSTFTSTYQNYRIILAITSGSTDIAVTGRLRASGSDDTTANYNTGYYGNANSNTPSGLADLNQTSAKLGLGISSGGVNDAHIIMDLIGPQVADKTLWSSASSYQISSAGNMTWYFGGGLMNTATQFDAFTFIASSGTITGNYRVYGYADS